MSTIDDSHGPGAASHSPERADGASRRRNERVIWIGVFIYAALIAGVAAWFLIGVGELERRIAETEALGQRLAGGQEAQKTRIEEARMALDEGLLRFTADAARLQEHSAQIQARLESVVSDLNTANASIERLGQRVADTESNTRTAIDAHRTSSDRSLATLRNRIDGVVETTTDDVESLKSNLNASIDRVDDTLETLDTNISRVEQVLSDTGAFMLVQGRPNPVERFGLVIDMGNAVLADRTVSNLVVRDASDDTLLSRELVQAGESLPFEDADHCFELTVAIAMPRGGFFFGIGGDDWAEVEIDRRPKQDGACGQE